MECILKGFFGGRPGCDRVSRESLRHFLSNILHVSNERRTISSPNMCESLIRQLELFRANKPPKWQHDWSVDYILLCLCLQTQIHIQPHLVSLLKETFMEFKISNFRAGFFPDWRVYKVASKMNPQKHIFMTGKRKGHIAVCICIYCFIASPPKKEKKIDP